MRGIKKVLVIALAVALAMPVKIFAEGIVSVSVKGKEVMASGAFEESAAKQYIAKVYKTGYTGGDNDEDYKEYLVSLMQEESQADGSFKLTLELDENLPSGEYLLKINSADIREELETKFSYFSRAELDEILEKFNNETGSAADVQRLTETYAEAIGIDFTAEFSRVKNQTSVYARMYALKPYSDITEVIDAFRSLCLLSLIEQASSGREVQSIMSENPEYFSLDDAVYGKLPEPVKALEKLRKYHSSLEAFEAALYEAIGSTAFSELDRTDMAELIEIYRGELDLPSDFDSYISSHATQALNLYKKLEAMSTFASFAEISSFITENYKSADGDSSGAIVGGGGFGGAASGISGGGVAVTKPEEISQPNVAPQITVPFIDLASADWAEDAIQYLYGQEMIFGVDSVHFEPNREVTREEFVAMIVRAFRVYGDSDANFTDVEPGAWYAEYIDRAVSSQVIKGKGDGTFGVGETLTRQDMAVILYRVASYVGVAVNEIREYSEFADTEQISDYAKSAVRDLYRGEILNGIGDNTFAPQATATRAMAAKTIYELLMH